MPRKIATRNIQARAAKAFMDEIEDFTTLNRGEFKALKQTEDARFEAYASDDGSEAEIDVYGVIGTWELNADLFRQMMRSIKANKITVNINSPGGSVFDGFAMYEELRAHPAEIHVRIRGLAASAASVLAMAGDTVEIADNGFIMIHNSWGGAVGDTREMMTVAKLLAKIDKRIAKTYSTKTGMDMAELAELMNDETWYDSEDAIEAGFADTMGEAAPAQALAHDVKCFNKTPRVLLDAARSQAQQPAKKADVKPAEAEPVDDGLSGIIAQLNSLCATLEGCSKNDNARPPVPRGQIASSAA